MAPVMQRVDGNGGGAGGPRAAARTALRLVLAAGLIAAAAGPALAADGGRSRSHGGSPYRTEWRSTSHTGLHVQSASPMRHASTSSSRTHVGGQVHHSGSRSHRHTSVSIGVGVGVGFGSVHHHHGRSVHHHGHSVVHHHWPVYDPYCSPVIVRRTVVAAPVVVAAPPQTVIVTQPQPVQTVVVAQPSPVVVAQPQPVVVASSPVAVQATVTTLPPRQGAVAAPNANDVVPAEMSLSAHRVGDTIMVHIRGINTGGAFNTSLAAGDLRVNVPTVVLYNTPVANGSTADTAFEVRLAIRPNQPASMIRVLLADQAYEVPVEVVQVSN